MECSLVTRSLSYKEQVSARTLAVSVLSLLSLLYKIDDLSGMPGNVGNLTAVRQICGNWPKVSKVSGEILVTKKLFVADFTFGTVPVFSHIVHTCLLYC